MTVAGNLTFQSGATYFVQVGPAGANFANVTGSASLAGTVQTVFASGSYLTKSYDILHSAGLGGTSFSSVTSSAPANFQTSLSYTSTDVLLNLTATLGSSNGLSGNQQNVAGALDSFFNNGGTLPAGFGALFATTGSTLANNLSQISGEGHAGSTQTTAYVATNQFIGTILDPSLDNRGGQNGSGGGATGYANEGSEAWPMPASAHPRMPSATPTPR